MKSLSQVIVNVSAILLIDSAGNKPPSGMLQGASESCSNLDECQIMHQLE